MTACPQPTGADIRPKTARSRFDPIRTSTANFDEMHHATFPTTRVAPRHGHPAMGRAERHYASCHGIVDLPDYRHPQWEEMMKTKHTVALSLCAGVTIGAIAMQGLHAQGAKLKAWSVGELEPVSGATVSPTYLKEVREAIAKAHGHPLRTVNGRVVGIEGAPPKIAAIVEWDSLDDAVAFYNSDTWKKFAPERDKAQKTIRRYVVEAER
jgi:uncharacterized protein (DUF1330 family)